MKPIGLSPLHRLVFAGGVMGLLWWAIGPRGARGSARARFNGARFWLRPLDVVRRIRFRAIPGARNSLMQQALVILAHELRTPLSAIEYTTAKLADRSAPADIRAAQDVIHRQVKQLSGLVEHLLDGWRIANGGLELHRGALDMRDVIHDAVDAVEALVKASRHTLLLSLPDHPVTVCGDRLRLVQMVVNLLTNAAKFTPSPGEVDVTLVTDDSDVTLRVRDTGVGIPAEMLERIFEPFTKLSGPRSGSSSGLGIGLALVRGIVALHGGAMTVHSDGPGCGSEFVVRLPGAAVASAAA